MMPARYLGDGVYVHFDGSRLVLTVGNGIEETERIVLESATYSALLDYVRALKQATT